MATLTGPLFSLQAAGAFGDTIIYERRKGTTYAKPYKVPTLTRYPSQRAVRAITRFLTKEWASANPVTHTTWLAPANAANLNPIAFFLKYNFARLWQDLAPTATYPANIIDEPPQLSLLDVTGATGVIDLSAASNGGGPPWGLRFYANLIGPPYTPHDLMAIYQPGPSGHPATFQIKNLLPGLYNVAFRTFSPNAAQDPTPTSYGTVTVD
jgi:hypothetical protein